MPSRIAINGYGRIGQSLLRAFYQRKIGSEPCSLEAEIVAINELADADTIAYLTRYDSTFGRFPISVNSNNQNALVVGDHQILVSNHSEVEDLKWGDLDIDLVLECTGVYCDYHSVSAHIKSGAKRVMLSRPGNDAFDSTVVYGVNHSELSKSDKVISCASCTSNAVVPLLQILDDNFEVLAGSLTTIHSAMNDQPTIDAYHHHDLRRTRSSMNNVVPVDTGLAVGVERLLPKLKGKLTATAMRVPTINVSAIELSLYVGKEVDAKVVNDLLAESSSSDQFGILHYTEEPLASSDFIGDSHSSIIDGSQTRVSGGRLIKILTWFDNEWAYANRMLDVANYWLSK